MIFQQCLMKPLDVLKGLIYKKRPHTAQDECKCLVDSLLQRAVAC